MCSWTGLLWLLLLLRWGQASHVASAPQTGAGCSHSYSSSDGYSLRAAHGCCSLDGVGCMGLPLLRHGQAANVAAAPRSGVGYTLKKEVCASVVAVPQTGE